MANKEIPQEVKVAPIHSTSYLVDGEIKEWKGPVAKVFSSIQSKNVDNEMAPTLMGSVPDMGEETALEALVAAEKAFNRGQGTWPTLPVKERIKCLETFVEKMKPQRDLVSKLLMWEIGKTQADAYKEFDRTVTYITDTCLLYTSPSPRDRG